MANSNILPLRQNTKPTPQTRKHTRATKAIRRQAGTAVAVGAVAVNLTALSLSHLAHGVEIVTGSTPWESWAMAPGIDCGFSALELSQLATREHVPLHISRLARPAVLTSLAR